jgi:hypothetical protein
MSETPRGAAKKELGITRVAKGTCRQWWIDMAAAIDQ